MVTRESFVGTWSPRLLSILRIVAALLYMQHGTMKLFILPQGQMTGTVPLISLFGLAGIIEVFGGFLLLTGLFTRPVAIILSGEMASAYFIGHAARNWWPILNMGEVPIIFCFLFLYFSVTGGGLWSLDAFRNRGLWDRDTVVTDI